MEARFHARLQELIGQRAPLPHHVLVNGWYFYSLNWIRPGNVARMLWKALRSPRIVAGILPETVRHAVPLMERNWRDDVQPRYRSAVARDAGRLATLPVTELPALIDGLAEHAGEYFLSLAALGGAAYKLEILLARFYQRHLAQTLGDSYVQLLAGLDGALDPGPHAVASLDWWQAPIAADGRTAPAEVDRRRLPQARESAEAAAEAALASSPRRLRTFRRLLADAQHLVPIREMQARELTIAWPVMREAVLRIGVELARRGVITAADDVFFLTRDEVLGALGGEDLPRDVEVTSRRAMRQQQARLVPPLFAGRLNATQRRIIETYMRAFGGARSERAIVSGFPASPGRATGVVRVVRGPDEFDDLERGDVLVAPLTAPAWTPLFTRAVAVVTDVGSPAAHASLIAREFGIPAVVGCGDATARLRTGMRVTVDGSTGNVEPG
jgi:pyruvate,water dikinase